MPDIIIRNVTYWNEVTNLHWADGLVFPVTEPKGIDAIEIDGTGLVAVNDLVDGHVHFRDPGLTEKEDLLSGARAAAAGGFGTVICEPNTRPVIDTPAAVHAFYQRLQDLQIPIHIYTKSALTVRQSGETLTDFAGIARAGAVAFSDDGEPIVSDMLLASALEQLSASEFSSFPITAHCEETPRSAARVRLHLGEGQDMMREPDIIRMHLAVLERMQASLHYCPNLLIQHISLAESARMIAVAKRNGLRVKAEVTPHHLLLCQDDIPLRAGEPDPNWKMNPPLRSRDDMLAMRQALAEGVIDCIATDHAPHTPEEKANSWGEAPFGVIGLETAIGACLTLVHDGTIGSEELFDVMSNKQQLVYSSINDYYNQPLTLIDMNAEWTVDPDKFYSKSRNCPFAGMTFKGKPMYTIAGGKLVMAEGEVLF